MFSSSRTRDCCYSGRRVWVGAGLGLQGTADHGCCCEICALHSPNSFDALRNRCERRIGNALTAKYLCRLDQTSGNAVPKPATLDPLIAIAALFRALPEFWVKSAQIRTKHRNLRQAILSESAHTLFVYARSMRAVSMLCSLRPLLASSIITQADLLPVGFAGLRHFGRWLSATGLLFVSSMHPRHSKTLRLRYRVIMDGA